MALLVAVIVCLFATAFGKPQYLVSANGVVTPHYYQQPLTYLYPRMTHQTYFHANPFFVPYTYPVNFATPSVVQNPKVQPYWLLTHCAKLKDKVTEFYNLVDANLDGKVTLAELRDDTLDTDPRVTAIWADIFSNLGGVQSTVDTAVVQGWAGDKYSEGLERPLFAKNDVNKDNSLNVDEFSNLVGDFFDVAIFFKPYDANQDYYLDKTEYEKIFKDLPMSYAEAVTRSNDGKLSVVETLTLLSLLENFDDSKQDLCASKKVAG